MSGNFTLQYQLTPSLSFQAGYVTSLARHLEVFPNSNNVTADLARQRQLRDRSGCARRIAFPGFRRRRKLRRHQRETATTMASRPRWKSNLRVG